MTAASFRKLALSLPDVVEHAHMGHPDFRVGGRIFATLGYPGAGWAMVGLTPYDQDVLMKMHPKAFVPVKGKWGEQGATNIELRHATAPAVRTALNAAYEARLARQRRARRPSGDLRPGNSLVLPGPALVLLSDESRFGQ